LPASGAAAQRLLFAQDVMQLRQMFSAGLGGGAATLVDVTSLLLMVKHGAPVAVAAFISAASGAAVAFLLNKYIAFRDRSPVTLQQLGRFGVVAVATALLMAVCMQVVAVKLGVSVLVAKVLCSAVVFVAWTYPAQRRLVFKPVLLGASS
jgi:putative flippase GtrA